jgi:hypothetical protein
MKAAFMHFSVHAQADGEARAEHDHHKLTGNTLWMVLP